MLQAAAFSGGEAAPMMDDVDGVALQCWGRREEMRVSQFGWRKSVRSCSPMMADGSSARAESGEEEGVFGGGSR
jgi:hypothetical protein